MQELEAKLDEQGRQCSEVTISLERVLEELETQGEQYQKDFAERDFAVDQTRKKYQGKFQTESHVSYFDLIMISRTGADKRR